MGARRPEDPETRMAEVTASMVKELRSRPGADDGMQEGAGRGRWRHGTAEDLLRVKLGNKAAKAASRDHRRGHVGAFVARRRQDGAMVELNCETDFVAKNDEFSHSPRRWRTWSRRRIRPTWPSLSALPLDGGSGRSARTALVGRSARTSRSGVSALARPAGWRYVHGGRIGVLVVPRRGRGDRQGPGDAHRGAAKPRCARGAWRATGPSAR